MLSLIFAMMTTASAEGPRAEPLFVSVRRGRVMVRVHDGGKVHLATCPVPAGAVPDLTFSQPGALGRCRVFTADLPDQSAALAAFGDEFERLVSDYARAPYDRRKVIGKTALIGSSYAALQAGAMTVIVKIAGHYLTAGERRMIYFLGGGLATVMGTKLVVDYARSESRAERERVDLADLPIVRERVPVDGPRFGIVSEQTFRVLTALAEEAVARVAVPKPRAE